MVIHLKAFSANILNFWIVEYLKALDTFFKKMDTFTTFCEQSQAVSPWTNPMNKFQVPKYGIKLLFLDPFDLI